MARIRKKSPNVNFCKAFCALGLNLLSYRFESVRNREGLFRRKDDATWQGSEAAF